MFISAEQLSHSLSVLEELHPFFGMSFLAFKHARTPVGETAHIIFSQVANEILDRHYRPSTNYDGYFNPFKTSRKAQRWLSPRYGSTSLQRITADTFGDALIHRRNSKEWGWKPGYVTKLKQHLQGKKIPAFDLGVWLFRNENWPRKISPRRVAEYILEMYKINEEEQRHLFDFSVPEHLNSWLSETPLSEGELFDIIGYPPGSRPEEGAALRLLELREIGPARKFRYQPSDRLNIITGDNSLGKTFILECAWWALTGRWLEMAVIPRKDVPESAPKITFEISTTGKRVKSVSANYDWARQHWVAPAKREVLPGLVIYARFDGSFAIWDPARSLQEDPDTRTRAQDYLFLNSRQIWGGLPKEPNNPSRTAWLCNGLLRDWVYWQTSGARYRAHFESLIACLRTLSPSPNEPLKPGEPTRLPFDTQEIPTLQMPYGDVPVVHASAGVQRVIALSYVMVWAWHEHQANSEISRMRPQRRVVLLIDEVEAHLHPRWQRVIVPGIMNAITQLAVFATPQIHLATHSPMVMASAETIFNEEMDDLHHLNMKENGEVELAELPFVKRGTADSWLMSEVFQLAHARSLPGEQAIEDAKALQLADEIDDSKVEEVNQRLIEHLAQDDEFWPRWRYFAKQHGVE